jgi:hypothetical protein
MKAVWAEMFRFIFYTSDLDLDLETPNATKNKSHVNMAIPRRMCLLIGRMYM